MVSICRYLCQTVTHHVAILLSKNAREGNSMLIGDMKVHLMMGLGYKFCRDNLEFVGRHSPASCCCFCAVYTIMPRNCFDFLIENLLSELAFTDFTFSFTLKNSGEGTR